MTTIRLAVVAGTAGVLCVTASARAQAPPPSAPNTASDAWHAEMRAGFGHQEVFAIAATGADIGLAVGVNVRRFGGYFDTDYFVGNTPAGLRMQTLRFAPVAEYCWSRFHFGGGPELEYFNLQLISEERGAITTWGVGVFAFARIDIVPFDGHAVFFDVRIHADSLDELSGNAATTWGPSASLGFRF